MPDNNDTYKRRDFLKMGAVSSGTIAGGKLKTGHTAEKGENMHDSEEKIVVLDTAQENMDCFYSCVGCSAFTPNHMCVITPVRDGCSFTR